MENQIKQAIENQEVQEVEVKTSNFEYSIPKKGNVTKQNAKDFYNVCKSLEIESNFNLCSGILDIIINEDLSKVKNLQKVTTNNKREATYKVNDFNPLVIALILARVIFTSGSKINSLSN